VGHAALLGVQAFSNLPTPPDVLGPAGHLAALVGLLGMYPLLAARTPTAARTAGVVVAVALASWAVLTVTRLLAVAGVAAPASDVLPAPLFMLLFASTILAYALFGGATVRAEVGSPTVGLLVLAPGALLAVVLVASAITGASALAGFVVGSGLALSILALGYTLRARDRVTDHGAPTGATAG
jgi:ABC-type multidrug transport system permease subunit